REQLPWHSLADYVADLERVVSCFDRPPVLIGHSMGGMIIQKFLEKNDATGVVLMASTPPHGLLASIVGMGVSNPLLLWQLALIQQLGPGYGQPAILHQALFSKNTPMHSVIDYAHLFGGESVRVSLDMLGLNPLNPAKKPNVPMLVLGAEHDAFFSTGIVHDTARTYGVEATTFSDMGHAMMLEREWRTVADRILDWLTGCLATTAQPEPAISG
ncbi:MAG: alpha/beta hydrolase, partial [Gammaproteobacteria bacterium]|nr:alpha/beta hydrolase [Gammaproteobacteria bacterium]